MPPHMAVRGVLGVKAPELMAISYESDGTPNIPLTSSEGNRCRLEKRPKVPLPLLIEKLLRYE